MDVVEIPNYQLVLTRGEMVKLGNALEEIKEKEIRISESSKKFLDQMHEDISEKVDEIKEQLEEEVIA